MTFFAGATYLGPFVLLAATGLAYRGGSALADAVVRGFIGFGLVIIAGYVADVVVLSAPLKPDLRRDAGPLIKTIAALTEGVGSAPDDNDDSEQQLAA